MKKIVKVLVLMVILAIVAGQFFKPEKNDTAPDPNHLFNQVQLPGEIKTILQNSCLDCHSNQTHYLWYHNFSPVAWMINDHIVEGKHELNLSEWGQLDKLDKISKLDEMCREVENHKMPLKAYLLMHPKAKLSDEQVAALCEWTEKLSEELFIAAN